jgi:hypothetical protein
MLQFTNNSAALRHAILLVKSNNTTGCQPSRSNITHCPFPHGMVIYQMCGGSMQTFYFANRQQQYYTSSDDL